MKPIFLFDIETSPDPRLNDVPLDIRDDLKDPAAIARAQEKAMRGRSLNPLMGKIVSWAYVTATLVDDEWVISDPVCMVDLFDEGRLLDLLACNYWADGGGAICALNGRGFDFDFTAVRCAIHGFYGLAKRFHPKTRWSSAFHFDPCDAVRSVTHNPKAAWFYRAFGIQHNSIDGGKQVFEWVAQNRPDKIKAHNIDDVVALGQLFVPLVKAGLIDVSRVVDQ